MIPDDLPVALRRQRRKSARAAQPQSEDSTPQSPRHSNRIRRPTSKLQEAAAAAAATTTANTTISTVTTATPRTPSKSASRRKSAARRRSEPLPSRTPRARSHNNASRATLTPRSGRATSASASTQKPLEPPSGIMTFQPLRTVLEGRVLRRIRRAGLSEEMNNIEAENRRRKRLLREQLQDLKSQLELRDREIDELRNSTLNTTANFEPDSRVLDLERQIEDLKNELNRSAMATPVAHKFDDWDMHSNAYSDDETEVATELASENNDHDDTMTQHILHRQEADDHNDQDQLMNDHNDEFGNTTIESFACGTPARTTQKDKKAPSGSFLTPPITSPAAGTFGGPSKNVSPESAVANDPSRTSQDLRNANAAVQAVVQQSDIDMAEDYSHESKVEDQLVALNKQMGEMLETMASYNRVLRDFKTQLKDYYIPNSVTGSDREVVQAKIASLLDAFNAKKKTLDGLNHSLHDLGFPGGDSTEIINSIRETFKAAHLELEYLIEGEYELPDTSNSAEIFDMVLAGLRDLSKRNKEDEEVIEHCHETENQLRRELAAASVSTAESHRQLAEAKTQIDSRDTKIVGLEGDIQCLQSGIDDRQHRLSEVQTQLAIKETKITGLEGNIEDLQSKLTDHQNHLMESQTQIANQLVTIGDLESTIKEMDVNIHGYQHQLTEANLKISNQNAEIVGLGDNIQRLQGRIADQTTEIEHLGQRAQTLEQEKASAQTTIAEQAQTIDEDHKAIRRLEDELVTLYARAENLEEELRDTHEQYGDELSGILDRNREHINTLEGEHAAEILLRDEQVAELGMDIARLNRELSEAEATIAGLREENDNLINNAEDQRMQATTMIEAVREDLEMALQRSAKFLMSPVSPAGERRRSQAPSHAKLAPVLVPAPATQRRLTGMVLPKMTEVLTDFDMDDDATIVA
ncbi:hypothetical protein BROUX41_003191 [Berkeleyomyces rouxiae]|uniref:uncharacterized protein n=1 Tax=Berkeleyomyces rouxiae TaxID=2035830 RepID=UPI003B78072B